MRAEELSTAEIRIARRGSTGLVVLDRPKALNALTHDMVRRLSRALALWRDDPGVARVVVRAVPGRAFCAGGDIRAIVETLRRDGVDGAVRFFFDEYRMNWRVRTFPKPYVALMDGITMGGGVGISVHGSRRIVTDRTVLAMPETGIGFFPDVCGTYFLPRLPDRMGFHMGLTGERMAAADCLALGLADRFVPSDRLDALVEALCALPADAAVEAVDAVLDRFAADPGPAACRELGPRTAACYDAPDFATLVRQLAEEPTGFGRRVLEAFAGKSPLSLRVTFEQLRRGASLDFADCMRLEYRMVHRFLACGEFAEGVRALVIDKDRSPRWRYTDWRQVPEDEVGNFFAPLAVEDLGFDWDGPAIGSGD